MARVLCLLLACMGLFSPVYALESEVTTLEPVVVTGTAHPTQLHQVTQSITILEEKQFSSWQPNRAATLLQSIPGIHIDETGTRGGISSLYIRGADPNFTLILLDGIPLNDSTNQRGGSVDLSTLPIERIERVELVRGPLSAIYGSEGMAGAVNFITRRPQQERNIRVLGEGGRFESFRGILQASDRIGPLLAGLSLAHSRNGSQVEKDRFSLSSVGWNISVENASDWDIYLTGQFSDSNTRTFPEGSGGSELALIQSTEHRKTQEFSTGLALAGPHHEHWHHQFQLNFLRRSQFISTPGILSPALTFQVPPAEFDNRFHRFQGRLIETWDMNSQWTFSGGGQLTYEQGERSGTQDLSSLGGSPETPSEFSLDRILGGTFGELTWSPTETVVFNGGLRLDLPQGFAPRISPRLGANYRLQPWLTLRGGYGTGYKLPSLASLGDPQIGNPTLEPETSTGWDIGIQVHSLSNAVSASVEYFHNRYHDLIDLDPELLNQGIFRLSNLQQVITKGVEFSLSLTPITQLSVNGTATFLQTQNAETKERLRNRPTWRSTGGLTYHMTPTCMITGRVIYVGSRRDFQIPTQTTTVAAYTRFDVTLTYRPSRSWFGYIVIENLTNNSYEEFRGFPAPPLTFRVGIDFQLTLAK
ncbi:MAG: TonB-dependent receptor plug domain-containing protein [Nitrospirales bacterium]|nr:TonB-dependent receptor [Nitrospirales bacterium]